MRFLGASITGILLSLAAGAVSAGSCFAAPSNTPVLRNFEEVNDALYRGAQPTREGFRELAKRGVHTVIDLRGGESRSSHEAEIVRGLGMQYVSFPLDGYKAPEPAQVSELL